MPKFKQDVAENLWKTPVMLLKQSKTIAELSLRTEQELTKCKDVVSVQIKNIKVN